MPDDRLQIPAPAALAGAPVVVVMGVAGCGKSTLGTALAQALGVPFLEGDALHDEASRAKMAAGAALSDEDRLGWLGRIGAAAAEAVASGRGLVASCSALKAAYRQRLRAMAPGLRFVYLELTPEVALARVTARAGSHFFPAGLVASQFAALEPPAAEPGVQVLDGAAPLADSLRDALQCLRATAP